MNVNPVTADAQQASSGAKLTADFNSFLKLLTAQLQNQDPLDPLDTNQFTQQLVSFSQVEQAIQQTGRLDAILARMSGQDLAAASGYIGREVSAYQPTSALDENGAKWFYDLGANAETTRLTIVDQYGHTVREVAGETGAGRHEITWDGTDGSGRQLPPGVYALKIDAKTAAGQAVASDVGTRGVVTSVETVGGEIILNLGATLVRASDIAAIAA